MNDRGLRALFTGFDAEAHFHAVHLFKNGVTHRMLVKVDLRAVLERDESEPLLGKQSGDHPSLRRHMHIDIVGCAPFADSSELEPQRLKSLADGFFERGIVLAGRDGMAGDLDDEKYAAGIRRFAMIVFRKRGAQMDDIVIGTQRRDACLDIGSPFRGDGCLPSIDLQFHGSKTLLPSLLVLSYPAINAPIPERRELVPSLEKMAPAQAGQHHGRDWQRDSGWKDWYLAEGDEAIAAFDCAGLEHFRIHSDMTLVVLNGGPQDPVVFGQIALGESRHHAAAARTGNGELRIADLDRLADPRLFDEAFRPVRRVDQHVRPEAPWLEASLRIGLVQRVQRGGGRVAFGDIDQCIGPIAEET